MPTKVEQLNADYSISLEEDCPHNSMEVFLDVFSLYLNREDLELIDYCNCKVIKYCSNDKVYYLLCANITYLGNPHPLYKKRIQIKKWWVDFNNEYGTESDVRFIGLYHHNGLNIFVDLKKECYLKNKCNNSSAHVYTNDLYQALRRGYFEKIDSNDNVIYVINGKYLNKYLQGQEIEFDDLLYYFKKFNSGFPFGKWVSAVNAIEEMKKNKWPQWKQTEWVGWFLEFKFDSFVTKNSIESKMKYIGSKNKSVGELDFDIIFKEDNFYGDLKASDIEEWESPGNDQENVLAAINRYNKFWYIIYEFSSTKDTHFNNQAAIERMKIIGNDDTSRISYKERMKYAISFIRMSIIELNPVNYRDVLIDFNQGKQASGASRKTKFKIDKKNIDNFTIFKYNYLQEVE